MDDSTSQRLTGQTVELLQAMIRNECVNDGTAESGQEIRNAATLRAHLEGTGVAIDQWEPTPGRASIVSRIEGSDPDAPSLCLMGHTDVVPVNPAGWSNDPFAGEVIDGEVWGRGAIDMLNITSSMAVAFRHLADTGFQPTGDLIFFGVADEESGSAHGAQWFADNEPDAIRADFVLTESGGLHSSGDGKHGVGMVIGEKGVAWRRLRVRGTPGHGSRPFNADNALIKAAAVVQRIAEYSPTPAFHELWRQQVQSLSVDDELKALLMNPEEVDDALRAMPKRSASGHLWSCTHTTFSPNLVSSDRTMKTNVIPDQVDINVDIRTMPGEDADSVQAHLDAALGDLADEVEVEILMNDPASISRIDTPLWDSLQKAVTNHYPDATINAQMIVGFTDARIFRNMGSTAYGAALFTPDLDVASYGSMFHGNDERVSVEALGLTTQLWIDVARDLLG